MPETEIETPEAPTGDGDGAAVGVTAPAVVPTHAVSLLLTAGSGTRFGTFVHEVFERLDFPSAQPHADDACASLDALLAALGTRNGYATTSREQAHVRAALPHILHTPLGSSTKHEYGLHELPGDFKLAQLSRADRLDELGFDLSLGAGTRYERPAARLADTGALAARPGCVDPQAVYAALEAANGDPRLKPWLDFQRQRSDEGKALIGSLAGILTGSIDLAFRVGETPESARYFVADYKTNRIEGCEPGHFTGPWLDWKMQTSGYLLQSLLYSLALHRHLRTRLRGYAYETHFGGALYLFVRGMVGTETPRCAETGHCLGVHAQRWPEAVIKTLDAALTPAAKETP